MLMTTSADEVAIKDAYGSSRTSSNFLLVSIVGGDIRWWPHMCVHTIDDPHVVELMRIAIGSIHLIQYRIV